MPIETGTYISDLVSTNPAHTDSVGQVDSHLRFIKATLLASFTGVTGAVTATHTALNAAAAAVVAGTTAAIHALGTAAAPSITFLGNLNTGIYSPGANQVAIATNGAQALLVKADGSLSGGTGQLGIIGEPRLWLSNTLPAGNFAWLNGQTVLIANNPVLWALWGTAHGGNGTTTLGLPNFQECVPVGRGTMGGAADPGLIPSSGPTATIVNLGSIVGEGRHALTTAELAAHSHGVTDPGHNHTILARSTGDIGALVVTGGGESSVHDLGVSGSKNSAAATAFTGISIQNAGSGTAHNVVQPSIVCNWIVLLG